MWADTAPKNALSLFSTLLSTLFFSPLSHPRLAFLVPVPGLEEGFIKSPGIPARPSCTEGKLSLSKRRFGFAFASAARRGAAGPALPRTPVGRGQMGVRGGIPAAREEDGAGSAPPRVRLRPRVVPSAINPSRLGVGTGVGTESRRDRPLSLTAPKGIFGAFLLPTALLRQFLPQLTPLTLPR